MLKHRIITGILVSAFSLGMVLFAPVWMLVVLMCAVYFLAQLEYCEMCKAKGYELERIGIFACGFLFLFATLQDIGVLRWMPSSVNEWLGEDHSLSEILLYLIPAFLAVQSVLRRKTERAAECLGLSILGVWYVAVLLSFMVRLALGIDFGDGRAALIWFILFVKMGDIGAYTFGKLWGHKIKRRLIPEISPAKSIPGLFGAYVGSLLVSVVFCLFLFLFVVSSSAGGPDLKGYYIKLIFLGLLMATVGVLGDLVESLLKRSFGVKDSSSRFPGMGGFLDILDSLLFAAPFMYFFVKLFF